MNTEAIKKVRGFTLIELMITVAIVGILAVIAYPAYEQQSRKGKRTAGYVALEKVAQAEERFMSQNNTYTVNVLALPGLTSTLSEGGNYDVTIVRTDGGAANPVVSWLATATPQGKQTKDTCGALHLSSTGQKTADGPGKCW